MKRMILAAVAAAVALLMPLPALACVPVPPKTWTGSLQFASHMSVGYTDFVANGCVFHDDRLNGADVVVFDVSSHAGLEGNVTWTTDFPVKPDIVSGSFLSASCGGLPGTGWSQMQSGVTTRFTIPATAKWLAITASTAAVTKDVAITLTSPGRTCPAAP